MLLQINTDIVVMIIDLMHVHSFHGHTRAGVKMLLFLELPIVLLCMLVIKRDILLLGEDPTQGLDDTTITAEAKCPINLTRSGTSFALFLIC